MKHRLTLLLCLGLMFAGAHAVLESIARFSERYLDAYLWKQQDHLRLFSPANHANRGHGRLWIYGPSEAREGLLPEQIACITGGLHPYQNSQSLGTLEDGLLVLEYIERAYGRSAIPDAILMGITPRFIANIRTRRSPLFTGINKYSPHFKVVETDGGPLLVPKTAWESARSQWSLLELQPDRYRRGVFAIFSRIGARAAPSLAADKRLWQPIAPAKYLTGKYASEQSVRKWLKTPGNAWEMVYDWEPQQDRVRVTRQLHRLTNFAARHGIQLYVVNLPELSWTRELYRPGRYEAYLSVVREALGPIPLLDLRTFVADEDFFDDAHPTWDAAIRISARVARFINQHRDNTLHARNTQ
jgi:hypothetical protein